MLTGDPIWPCICQLRGRELKTLAFGRPFEVVDVGDDRVTLSPTVSGKHRVIRRSIVEDAFTALVDRRELTSIEIAEAFTPYHAVYVAALLAAIPDVAVCQRPVRLIFVGHQLFYL